jgi:hypothetical protein
MVKRKTLARREPNGRVQRTVLPDAYSPAEISRLRVAAMQGMRDPVWGQPLGWLYMSHKISSAQFGAGMWWGALATAYSSAQQSPRQPRSAALERKHASSIDPDSAAGRREAERHEEAIDAYTDALDRLKTTGTLSMRVVIEVCEKQQMPGGAREIEALQNGLKLLAALRFSKRPTGIT